ncbi:DUF4056 domain-containing protein [Vibrio parahaemolyticus]|uniref:DUF4056 domain-containing protein n=1 Tax=Vibrio parahaemolyticus TaxID=670 RepID=UPI00215247A7|nr:DUF4056 domain-containing protein [Vibrio parahaemolyticus]
MQKVKIGAVPVPFFRLSNVVELEEIGPHKFASGIYHYTPSSSSHWVMAAAKITESYTRKKVALSTSPMCAIQPMTPWAYFSRYSPT